jgi:dimethylhistidine N-methyltransferase
MTESIKLYDFEPATENILDEVLDGLGRIPKQLPPKLFYDDRGSALFERITELPEYYPTRTEARIMHAHGGDMAEMIGPGAMVIEYGSGSSEKTRILLDHLEEPIAYVPIEISRDHLLESAAGLAEEYPDIDVLPVCADYEQPIEIPSPERPVGSRVAYFPGSTIGNFHPDDAAAFMRRIASHAGPDGSLLVGVDLKKDPGVLHRAYNDAQGVTAAFNANMLLRLNREIGADFDIEHFEHRAFYNENAGRIEMHLVSTEAQTVSIDGAPVEFASGESIWTESSYKYSVEEFGKLAARAGFILEHVWTDQDDLFSVQYLRASNAAATV